MPQPNGYPHRRLGALSCLAALLASVGCGSGDGLVEVSGVVLLDGSPLSSGQIDFFPEVGRPSSGQIDSEGRYQLSTNNPGDGANPGAYVVTVTSRKTPNEEPMYASIEDELNGVRTDGGRSTGDGRVQWLAPPRYSNRASSGLTAEVTPSGGEIDFQLTSKP